MDARAHSISCNARGVEPSNIRFGSRKKSFRTNRADSVCFGFSVAASESVSMNPHVVTELGTICKVCRLSFTVSYNNRTNSYVVNSSFHFYGIGVGITENRRSKCVVREFRRWIRIKTKTKAYCLERAWPANYNQNIDIYAVENVDRLFESKNREVWEEQRGSNGNCRKLIRRETNNILIEFTTTLMVDDVANTHVAQEYLRFSKM